MSRVAEIIRSSLRRHSSYFSGRAVAQTSNKIKLSSCVSRKINPITVTRRALPSRKSVREVFGFAYHITLIVETFTELRLSRGTTQTIISAREQSFSLNGEASTLMKDYAGTSDA